MGQSYEIVSIQKAEAPSSAEGSNWYDYVIAFDGADTVYGCRQGSRKDVTSAVEEIVDQLNERYWKKRSREKKT